MNRMSPSQELVCAAVACHWWDNFLEALPSLCEHHALQDGVLFGILGRKRHMAQPVMGGDEGRV